MRVLAFVHYYLPDNRAGAELMLHSMLKTLVDEGHEVWVGATQAAEAHHVVDGVHVLGGPSARALLYQDWDRVISHLAEVDRIRTWAQRTKTHFTQLVHSDHRWIKNNLAKGTDLAVFNTQWLASEMHKSYRGPSLVVHPPVDPAHHATTPGECVTLVNLIAEKGTHVFYRSAMVLKSTPFLGVKGGYLRDRQITKRSANVTIQEHTDDMKNDVWSRTKLLIMPSSYESFGMTALEAAASGIPTIATDTPGLRECLGSSGTFMPSSASPAWSKIIRQMTQDEDLYKVASGKALERSALMQSQTEKELKSWVHTLASV